MSRLKVVSKWDDLLPYLNIPYFFFLLLWIGYFLYRLLDIFCAIYLELNRVDKIDQEYLSRVTRIVMKCIDFFFTYLSIYLIYCQILGIPRVTEYRWKPFFKLKILTDFLHLTYCFRLSINSTKNRFYLKNNNNVFNQSF